jgi:hypothetical protein
MTELTFFARSWLNWLTIGLAVASIWGRRRLALVLRDLVTMLALLVAIVLVGLWVLASKLEG